MASISSKKSMRCSWNSQKRVLNKYDFLPPQETRTVESMIEDIDDNTFEDFLVDFWELCKEEEIYEDF